MRPKSGGASPEIWPESTSQSSELDENGCKRISLTQRNRTWASNNAGGTDVRPLPSLARPVPAEFWATTPSYFEPVFPTPLINPQRSVPRAGAPQTYLC